MCLFYCTINHHAIICLETAEKRNHWICLTEMVMLWSLFWWTEIPAVYLSLCNTGKKSFCRSLQRNFQIQILMRYRWQYLLYTCIGKKGDFFLCVRDVNKLFHFAYSHVEKNWWHWCSEIWVTLSRRQSPWKAAKWSFPMPCLPSSFTLVHCPPEGSWLSALPDRWWGCPALLFPYVTKSCRRSAIAAPLG